LSSRERKPSTERRRALSYADVKPVLEWLGDLTEQIVLVGGQAVSFWVDFYAAQVPSLAQLAPLTTTDIDFRVMQPVLVMESRVHNTMGLPGYRSTHSLQQLRVSVACARQYLRTLLDASEVRAVLKLNERIFTFCIKNRDGREVHAKHGVDPFDAVVADDDRLPTRFRETPHPQMQRELTAHRARRRR
jgi:hypothetical protein